MNDLWYVSEVSASTTVTALGRCHWTPHFAAALLSLACCLGCAGSSSPGGGASSAGPATAAGASIEAPGARDANLAGARCSGGPGAPCACRQKNGDVAETHPPDADHKRFEIRLGATGGGATLDSPTLGHFAADSDETCYYIDVLPGTTQQVTFTARAASKEGGVAPRLDGASRFDASRAVAGASGSLRLPFSFSEVIDNLRLEHYRPDDVQGREETLPGLLER